VLRDLKKYSLSQFQKAYLNLHLFSQLKSTIIMAGLIGLAGGIVARKSQTPSPASGEEPSRVVILSERLHIVARVIRNTGMTIQGVRNDVSRMGEQPH
jgi:hypothetical protein